MLPYKLLSLDETGKVAYKHPSELFILSGIVIPEALKQKVNQRMCLLKKKYFGDEELVFHSRDMARHKGQFASLADHTIEAKFWGEFVSIINTDEISCYFIITDKKKASKLGWQPATILRRSYLRILSEFARHLKATMSHGKVINESEPSQDIHLLYAHNRLQSMGIGDGSVEAKEYKKMVTCLSLVNKANLDIDVQIADALAPISGIKYRLESGSKVKITQPEKVKYRLIERKLDSKTGSSLFEVLL